MSASEKSFSFLVLIYNHEKYILEHLESIKYLILRYGKGIYVQLIVNDDCSSDKGRIIVDQWVGANQFLFGNVVKIYNEKNLGTCKSLCNMLGNLSSNYCKITAGDDVYSYENIFDFGMYSNQADIISGIPLSLVDGVISRNDFDINNIIATDVIYKNRKLIDRFKWVSVNNAPNIMYAGKHLRDEKILKFVSGFDVVEDLPLQIAIAESSDETTFLLHKKVYVYYRRTVGSTYIVASSRFYKDQTKIFKYLIEKQHSFFQKIVLCNRLMCFISGKKFVKRLMNFSVICYLFLFIKKFFAIRKNIRLFEDNVATHMEHYLAIKKAAYLFNEGLSTKDD